MKLKCSLFLGTFLTLSGFSVYAAEMNAGVIHFTGEIIDPSCEIKGDPGHDITVPLGTYPTSLFTTVGTESTLTPFRITLENCPVTSAGLPAVQLTFNGPTTVSGSTDLLDVTSGAKNVAIAISQDTDPTKLIKLDGTEDQLRIDLPTTSADSISAHLVARYKAFALPVSAGHANADLTVNILYR